MITLIQYNNYNTYTKNIEKVRYGAMGSLSFSGV